MSGMSPQKLQRELAKALTPMGWTLLGTDGAGHSVWIDPKGRIMRTPNTPRNPDRAIRTAKGVAKRTDALYESVNRKFIEWLLERYEVGKREVMDVQFELGEMIGVFEAATGLHQARGLYTQASEVDHRLTRLDRRQGVPTKNWQLRGALAVPEPLDNGGPSVGLEEGDVGSQVCEARLPLKGGGFAICTRQAGHEGEHIDKMRKTSWTVKPEPTPVAEKIVAAAKVAETATPEPVITEPVKQSREEKIAALIQELVGEPDDTRAEMAIEMLVRIEQKLAQQITNMGELLAEIRDALEVLRAEA